jgi:ribonuclease HI
VKLVAGFLSIILKAKIVVESDRDKIKKLLFFLSAGGVIGNVWRRSGYPSLSQARAALRDLAEKMDELGGLFREDLVHESTHSRSRGEEVERRVKKLIVYTDGSSKGNPGPSAVAAVAYLPSGEMLTTAARKIGKATNNVSEYLAVIEGLKLARSLKAANVEIRLDSELVAKQIVGEYKVKSPDLKPLFAKTKEIAGYFENCKFKRIPRESNKEADRIASSVLNDKPTEY